MPSVVSWNTQNLNRKQEEADQWHEDDAVAASADNEQAGKSKKRRDLEGSEQMTKMINANAFSTSYDWSYRENHLSRTAKKAARISLTTDTIEMMTCGLEGLDDRYDGSGWTTWKKKDDGQKKKFNKDGSEKRPRKVQARQPKAPGDPLALPCPKIAGSNIPRWFKGVPRCPELLLPTDDDIGKPKSAGSGERAVTGGPEAAGCGADTVAAAGDGASAHDETPAVKAEASVKSAGLSREEKKVLAQMDLFRKQEQRAAEKKASGGNAAADVEGSQSAPCVAPDPSCNSGDGESSFADPKNSGQSLSVSGGAQLAAPPCPAAEESSEQRAVADDAEQASKQKGLGDVAEADSADGAGAGAAASGEDAVGDAASSAAAAGGGQRSLLPLPTQEQLVASNLALGDGETQLFQLPYMAARYKFQKEFEDYACGDASSEFPTPFVPMNKNEYVDEDAAYRLPVHEGKNICQCIFVPGTPETACGEQSNCLLRDIYIECGDRCPSGRHCLNKRMQKKQWAKCR